jgi:hypothetical protein
MFASQPSCPHELFVPFAVVLVRYCPFAEHQGSESGDAEIIDVFLCDGEVLLSGADQCFDGGVCAFGVDLY